MIPSASLSSLALFAFLHTILLYFLPFRNRARVHLFDTSYSGRKTFPRINNSAWQFLINFGVINNCSIYKCSIYKSIPIFWIREKFKAEKLSKDVKYITLQCILKFMRETSAIPASIRPLFSLDATPYLAIKFSLHIIWLAADKIPWGREAGTLFMALTLANQDVSVGSAMGYRQSKGCEKCLAQKWM